MERLVGRDGELRAVDALLGSACAGTAGLVVEGPAGIGKTALLEEATHRAESAGFTVLAGWGVETETTWSLLPVADLLEAVPDEAIQELPPPQRHALDVVRRRADAGDRPVEPATIATALRAVLTGLARTAPVLLVLDDVHWLDPTSADVLRHTLRRLRDEPVAVLAAHRLPETAALDVPALLPAGRCARVRPEGLSMGALRQVLESRLEVPLTRATLSRIRDASAGNPLHALEIGRVLAAEGVPPLGEPLPVPDDVQELVRRRVDQLPAAARPILLRLALSEEAGRLVPASALTADEATQVDAAVRAGVLRIERRLVRFGHPLHLAAVIAGSTEQARREQHAVLAAAASSAEERARHLVRSIDPATVAAADELEEGARAAAARGAVLDAAALLVRAYDVTPASDLPGARRRGIRAAELLTRYGEHGAAAALLDRVEGLGPLRGADLAAALAVRSDICSAGDDWDGAERLLVSALDADPDAHLCGLELMALRAQTGDFAGAREVEERLLPRLDPATDGPMLSLALAYAVMARHRAGEGIDWTRMERALALEDPDWNPPTVDPPRAVAGYLACEAGRLEEARAALLDVQQDLTLRGNDDGYIESFLAWIETQSGRFREAQEQVRHGILLADVTGNLPLVHQHTATLAILDVHLGDHDAARDRLEALGRPEPSSATHRIATSARVLLAVSEGRWEDALAIGADDLAHVEEHGLGEPTRSTWTLDVVEALGALGDRERTARLADLWAASADELGHPWVRAAASRCRAVAAAAADDHAAAVVAAADAADAYAAIGMQFHRARCLLVRGVSERRIRRWGDARSTLSTAVTELERLGARGWAARARGELERVGTRARSDGSLTPSEQRVVELAAQGLRNKEIATTLSISVHTVERHLSNAFTKLGVTRRAQLAARLAAADPVAPT